MNIELTHPSGLWSLLLLGPLILLYILRVQRHRVVVPATWLWAAVERDLRARAPFRRLSRHVSLLLQILALLLLALALSEPSTRAPSLTGDHIAIVIDSGASMAARDPGQPSSFERARVQALALVAALPPGADAMIVQAARTPLVVSGLERDRRRLRTALESIEVRHEPSQVSHAVSVAVQRLARLSGSARVVVIGDPATEVAGTERAAIPIEVQTIGEPLDNTGIVRFDVRRSDTDSSQVEVFVSIKNFGVQPASRFVTLHRRGSTQALASRKLQLGPGERTPVTLSFSAAATDAGAGLVVELSPNDAFVVDDRAFGVVPKGPELRVYLSPPGQSVWLARALASDPDVELVEVSAEEHRGLDLDGSLNVFSGYCPERAPPADTLIVNPPAGRCVTLEVGPSVTAPTITSWALTDPRMRFLTIERMAIRQARAIRMDGPRGRLIQATEHTIAADMDWIGRNGTLLAFDVAETDWPLRASFVLFVRNLTELARATRAERLVRQIEAGAPVQLRVPDDIGQVTVEAPDGRQKIVAVRGSIATIPAAARVGHYLASWSGERPGSALFGVNLTSEAESHLGRSEAASDTPESAAAPSDTAHAVRRWAWLAALWALAALIAELIWETRRPKRLSFATGTSVRPVRPDRGRK